MTEIQREVIDLLEKGLTPTQVSNKLNRNTSTISSVIKKFNITEYNTEVMPIIDPRFFNTIDTSKKAYALGLFIADGWIHGNRMGISLQDEDSYILEVFQNFTGREIFIRDRTTPTINRKLIHTIRWTNASMVEDLSSLGVIPNKTYNKDFKFPFHEIEGYERDFIRGFIDGDGCIESGKSVLTITLVNTSELFLKQIGQIISNIKSGINYNIRKVEGKTTDYYVMRVSYNRTNKPYKVLAIYNYLYEDASYFLKRKKEAFEVYLKYRGKLQE